MMIAVAIGLLLMVVLVSTFQSFSNSQRELERSGQLIENDKFTIEMVSEDLRHAGYFGHYSIVGDTLAALFDTCEKLVTNKFGKCPG